MQLRTRNKKFEKTIKTGKYLFAAISVFCSLVSAAAAQMPGDLFDVDVFTRIPNPPGLPEGIAVGADGAIYAATNPGANNPAPHNGNPSCFLVYEAPATLRRQFVIQGQDMTSVALPAYGLQALAFDGNNLLYALDKAPARVLTINTQTGAQRTYATFPDVPPCSVNQNGGQCSDSLEDLRPFPNYLAFAPDGNLYVSDFQQALVWRVPPGGGVAQVAFTNIQLSGGMGPNGSQFLANGTTFLLATSLNAPGFGTPGAGRIYTLERNAATKNLENLQVLYESNPGDGPDGFAVSASGKIFLNFFLANQIAVIDSATGAEITRIGAMTTGANGATDANGIPIPFDAPASSAFSGQRLFVTNHAVNTRNPNSFAIFDIFAGEAGLPLFRPVINAPTAASVSIGGRVKTSFGRGIGGAIVTLTDQNGETRRTPTNPFGYYRFNDVAAGETIVVGARAKRYEFAPQAFSVNEDALEVNFTAQSSIKNSRGGK